MKKTNKKLIALLSVCCAVTAAVAFAGCDKDKNKEVVVPDKTPYEIAVELGFTGTEAEWIESLKNPEAPHEHEFGETIVAIAPTGLSNGIGYKECPVDGDQRVVTLPAVKGIIAQNPIEIAVGETKEVTINTYDGADVTANGEKGVMYFKTTVDETGYIAMPTDVPEGVEVTYEFFREGTYAEDDKMASRNVAVMEPDEGKPVEPKDVYVKATFKSVEVAEGETAVPVPEKVNVTSQHTVLNDADNPGKIKYTIKLEKGTAEELKVTYKTVTFSWRGEVVTWHEVPLAKDGVDLDGNPTKGDYTPFNGTDTAIVWLEPSVDAYKVEIIGLDEEYCIADKAAMETFITFPMDGSHDMGGEFIVPVADQFEYSFTVKGYDDTLIVNAIVKATSETSTEVITATTDENGVATMYLPQMLDAAGEIVFDWSVNLDNLPVGQGVMEASQKLIPVVDEESNYAVELKATQVNVPDWTVGTEYDIAAKTMEAVGFVTVEEAGTYTITLSDGQGTGQNMFTYLDGGYVITVNGVAQDLTGGPWAVEADFIAGKNGISIKAKSSANGMVYAMKVCVTAPEVETGPVEVELDTNNQMEIQTGVEYKWVATAADEYKITFGTDDISNILVYESKADADADTYFTAAWIDGMAITNGDRDSYEVMSVEADDVVIFYVKHFEGEEITLTLTIEEYVPTAPTAIQLNTATVVEKKVEYVFTAATAGTYYITCNYPEDWTNWNNVTLSDSKYWSEEQTVYYDSMEGKYGVIEVVEGENTFWVQGLYVSEDNDPLTITILTEKPADYVEPEGGDIEER